MRQRALRNQRVEEHFVEPARGAAQTAFYPHGQVGGGLVELGAHEVEGPEADPASRYCPGGCGFEKVEGGGGGMGALEEG